MGKDDYFVKTHKLKKKKNILYTSQKCNALTKNHFCLFLRNVFFFYFVKLLLTSMYVSFCFPPPHVSPNLMKAANRMYLSFVRTLSKVILQERSKIMFPKNNKLSR